MKKLVIDKDESVVRVGDVRLDIPFPRVGAICNKPVGYIGQRYLVIYSPSHSGYALWKNGMSGATRGELSKLMERFANHQESCGYTFYLFDTDEEFYRWLLNEKV